MMEPSNGSKNDSIKHKLIKVKDVIVRNVSKGAQFIYKPVAPYEKKTWSKIILLSSSSRFRLLTILWSVVVVFLGVMILSSSNPFNLLIPGTIFPLPVKDQRSSITIYSLAEGQKETVPTIRKVLMTGTVEDKVRRIAEILSRPPEDTEHLQDHAFIDLEPIPDLSLDIRKIWLDKEKSELMIDFRSSSLDADLDAFINARKREGATSTAYFENWLKVFLLSVKENISEVKRIHIFVDGDLPNPKKYGINSGRPFTR